MAEILGDAEGHVQPVILDQCIGQPEPVALDADQVAGQRHRAQRVEQAVSVDRHQWKSRERTGIRSGALRLRRGGQKLR